ncbi:hypothetical protein [Mycoplana ramosa]|uniref:Uncharacterized protein n=1 Tax=Mycoplana ramosa TaxID=40837 RepID=A0ABW3YV89_MYCRA
MAVMLDLLLALHARRDNHMPGAILSLLLQQLLLSPDFRIDQIGLPAKAKTKQAFEPLGAQDSTDLVQKLLVARIDRSGAGEIVLRTRQCRRFLKLRPQSQQLRKLHPARSLASAYNLAKSAGEIFARHDRIP